MVRAVFLDIALIVMEAITSLSNAGINTVAPLSIRLQFLRMVDSCYLHIGKLFLELYRKAHPKGGLLYRASDHLHVEAFTDSDWVGGPSLGDPIIEIVSSLMKNL